ncbi:hypothetical protein M595_4728 [Lyngbya aestuarii BL J]|uniref:Uncharacterized protein n=1 Tax=Lyngbya aestuarii BL J TaxID=1348334 RepID=U7QDL7_9CYAN|nr:hypothetical protein M595_4728 [Lyngbya aestuarii BL J]
MSGETTQTHEQLSEGRVQGERGRDQTTSDLKLKTKKTRLRVRNRVNGY